MRSIALILGILFIAYIPMSSAAPAHAGTGTWQTSGVGYAGTGTVSATYSDYNAVYDRLAITHQTTTLPSGATGRGTFYLYFAQDITGGGVFTDAFYGCTIVAGDFHAPATTIDGFCAGLALTFHLQVMFH